MKNILIFAVLLCIFSLQAKAQTEKGTIILGGNVSFSTHKYKIGQNEQKMNYSYASLRSGYFVNNNLAIGLGLIYNHTISKSNANVLDGNKIQSKQTRQSYGLAPFARYYFNISEKFKIFTEVAINGNIGDSKYVFSEDQAYAYNPDYKFKGFGVAAKPGLAFFPVKKLAIEFSFPMLSYQKGFSKSESDEASTSFKENGEEFKIGIDTFKPEIGVYFHF
ncbi:outer membrane beta-barrel protein [Pedobacter nyackensis]|uniref:Opacity protein n=1 Tax=Pedobacter nyackensis TaxID=475255 RepID=A0A1W2AGG1_9SPHI|nr:outer membrane beta-barrel protein [Pedobacter nyackensis]SMC59766.1 Opacity protein [Pedobacter nyackensis]